MSGPDVLPPAYTDLPAALLTREGINHAVANRSQFCWISLGCPSSRWHVRSKLVTVCGADGLRNGTVKIMPPYRSWSRHYQSRCPFTGLVELYCCGES